MDHARPSLPTLCSSTCLRGLKRCSEYVRPYVIQFAESESAARSAASSTSACREQPAMLRIDTAAVVRNAIRYQMCVITPPTQINHVLRPDCAHGSTISILNFQAGGIVYRVADSETQIARSEEGRDQSTTLQAIRFATFGIDGKISTGVERGSGASPYRKVTTSCTNHAQ